MMKFLFSRNRSPWMQEKLSGNLLYPLGSPDSNSCFLALFSLISEASSQLVCEPSFPTKLMSFANPLPPSPASSQASPSLIPKLPPHQSFSVFQRNKTYSYLLINVTPINVMTTTTKFTPASRLLHTLFHLPTFLHLHLHLN